MMPICISSSVWSRQSNVSPSPQKLHRAWTSQEIPVEKVSPAIMHAKVLEIEKIGGKKKSSAAADDQQVTQELLSKFLPPGKSIALHDSKFWKIVQKVRMNSIIKRGFGSDDLQSNVQSSNTPKQLNAEELNMFFNKRVMLREAKHELEYLQKREQHETTLAMLVYTICEDSLRKKKIGLDRDMKKATQVQTKGSGGGGGGQKNNVVGSARFLDFFREKVSPDKFDLLCEL
eukprot:PhF_6_TR27027/c0_g1_i1/m.39474